jgi:CDP-diacylglycerol--glycerol-3-phosphate 3-phosphatidyltransferase
MAVTIYDLKPRFQGLLRPLARRLAAAGVTANQVTTLAMGVSIVIGAFVWWRAEAVWPFLLLPLWLFVRMALNAIDGMLAREFGQQSALGAYLNELSDVVSDAALYLPFAQLAPFSVTSVGLVILLAALSEMAGALGPMVGAPRRYDGPIGKSDRAFVFGARVVEGRPAEGRAAHLLRQSFEPRRFRADLGLAPRGPARSHAAGRRRGLLACHQVQALADQ